MEKLGGPIDNVVLSHDRQLAMIVTNKEQVQIDPISLSVKYISLLSTLCSTYIRCSSCVSHCIYLMVREQGMTDVCVRV